MNNVNENTKDAWMNIVKQHRKRQKGLPALSTLNTNAGNVEKGIELFNAMQGDGDVFIDASNGNVSSTECCGGMGESLLSDDNSMRDKITFYYENLPIEVVTRKGNSTGYYDYGMGAWYPDEDDTKTILVDWSFSVDKKSLVQFLQDLGEVQMDLNMEDLTDEDYTKQIEEQLDTLIDRYEKKIKEYFYDDAVKDAEENYEYIIDEELQCENCEKETQLNESKLDDTFDMSMRTLL